jgi:hypothetical protein
MHYSGAQVGLVSGTKACNQDSDPPKSMEARRSIHIYWLVLQHFDHEGPEACTNPCNAQQPLTAHS